MKESSSAVDLEEESGSNEVESLLFIRTRCRSSGEVLDFLPMDLPSHSHLLE